jgi:uncharacterized protein YcbK (DUF882 family)
MSLRCAPLISLAVALLIPYRASAAQGEVVAAAVTTVVAEGSVVRMDSIRGRSGKLMARLVGGSRGGPLRVLQELFGDSATRQHGIYEADIAGGPLSFITLLPFGAKEKGRVGSYRIGSWPRESRGNPDLPDGFIEVTPANQDTYLTKHFRLRDFVTHDQANIWPKYVVVRETLLDKLELVITDLQSRGHTVERVKVLSGFRTPAYNRQGVGRGGRALDSRHQYGDAADIYVDNDDNGRMDDLNRDGRSDSRDIRLLIESVERVERSHPDLTGGVGLYRATRSHGPFVHVDARGSRVRWGFGR